MDKLVKRKECHVIENIFGHFELVGVFDTDTHLF
jgi:hypothetical protein